MRLLYLPRFDVDRWFDAVEERRPQATFVVPAMVELLIVSPRFDDGRPVEHPDLLARERTRRPGHDQRASRTRLPKAMVSNAWGMTEAGPAFCFMPPEEQAKRVGSVGKPVPPDRVPHRRRGGPRPAPPAGSAS